MGATTVSRTTVMEVAPRGCACGGDPRRIPSAAPKLSVTQRSLQLTGRQHPAPYCLFCKTTTASSEARRREEHMGLVAGLIGVVGDLLHLLLGGL